MARATTRGVFPARAKAQGPGGRAPLRRRGAEARAGGRALCPAAGHAGAPLSHGQRADPAPLPRARQPAGRPDRGPLHRRSHGRRGAGGRSLLPRRAGLSRSICGCSTPRRRSRRRRSPTGEAHWPSRKRRPAAARDAFDAALGPYDSRLVGYDPDAERVMAEAVRTVLGVDAGALPDEDALAQVLDPTRNPYLGHPLFLGMHSKLMQTMNHVPFTLEKRISVAEDAQNQRHRGTLGSRPALLAWNSREPDVIVPWAIRQNPAGARRIRRDDPRSDGRQERLLDRGVPPEAALYLLPERATHPLLRERHAARLLLEVGQAALLRRAAGDLRDGGRRSRPGAGGPAHDRTLCRWSALRHALPRRRRRRSAPRASASAASPSGATTSSRSSSHARDVSSRSVILSPQAKNLECLDECAVPGETHSCGHMTLVM